MSKQEYHFRCSGCGNEYTSDHQFKMCSICGAGQKFLTLISSTHYRVVVSGRHKMTEQHFEAAFVTFAKDKEEAEKNIYEFYDLSGVDIHATYVDSCAPKAFTLYIKLDHKPI